MRATLRSAWRWTKRTFAVAGVALVVLLLHVLVGGGRAFGHRATGARRARMEASPEFKDGRLVNPQPLVNDLWLSLLRAQQE